MYIQQIPQIQHVTIQDTLRNQQEKYFSMIDNYIYLYHTNTLIALPLFPESIQDSMTTNYTPNTPMSRSAPIYSYSSSGPRSLTVELPLHRDMMNSVNVDNSSLFAAKIDELSADDYVDVMINQLQSAALPRYAASEKMVDPPLVAIRFGNSIFCKGVVVNGISTAHSGPILSNNKYAVVTVSFTINEVDPYDADTVALEGGFRGIRTSLESKLFSKIGSSNSLSVSSRSQFQTH